MRPQTVCFSTNIENHEREIREEDSWRRNHGASILGGIWEAFEKHLGSILEASEKHLGTYENIWKAIGETYLGGVSKRRKIMGDYYFHCKNQHVS